MKLPQSVPTDNLYKFSAILGLLLTVLFTTGYFYVDYVTQTMKASTRLVFPASIAEEENETIACRWKALEKGKLDECIIEGLPNDGSEAEKTKLRHRQRVNQEILDRYAKYEKITKPVSDFFEILGEKSVYFIWVITAICILSVLLLVFGFWRWISKIQNPMNKATELDLKIKELELEKLEIEVKKLKEPTITPINLISNWTFTSVKRN